MRINKITTVSSDTPNVKSKLIAASHLINSAGKYLSSGVMFFSWTDGVLRQYAATDHTSTPFPSFKDALKHIQSL